MHISKLTSSPFIPVIIGTLEKFLENIFTDGSSLIRLPVDLMEGSHVVDAAGPEATCGVRLSMLAEMFSKS